MIIPALMLVKYKNIKVSKLFKCTCVSIIRCRSGRIVLHPGLSGESVFTSLCFNIDDGRQMMASHHALLPPVVISQSQKCQMWFIAQSFISNLLKTVPVSIILSFTRTKHANVISNQVTALPIKLFNLQWPPHCWAAYLQLLSNSSSH